MIVGDSADYTLRTYALSGSAEIQFATFTADRTFSQSLVQDLANRIQTPITGALLLRGMAIHQDVTTGDQTQVNQV